MSEDDYVCDMCGEGCDVEEESFTYSGTHCTGGADGVHYTGNYVSKCCGVNFSEKVMSEDELNELGEL